MIMCFICIEFYRLGNEIVFWIKMGNFFYKVFVVSGVILLFIGYF